jgi:hypothetical protein
MYQAKTKNSQGILKVNYSFGGGGIISANGLLASELVNICDSSEKQVFKGLSKKN